MRLGETVRRDRLRAGMRHQTDLAERAGIGRTTVSKIERGVPGNYDERTKIGIEAALGWAPGTFERLLSSGQVERADEDWSRLESMWPRLSMPMRRGVVAAVEAIIRSH